MSVNKYALEVATLDEKQAVILLKALETASVPALAAEPFICAIMALRRIAEGKDIVKERINESSE